MLRHHSLQSKAESRDMKQIDDGQGGSTEVVGNLQSLYQAVLSRIRDRHAALSDRASAWEHYRSALSKLLTWIDAAERERKNLALRQIQEHGLPTALHRVKF